MKRRGRAALARGVGSGQFERQCEARGCRGRRLPLIPGCPGREPAPLPEHESASTGGGLGPRRSKPPAGSLGEGTRGRAAATGSSLQRELYLACQGFCLF